MQISLDGFHSWKLELQSGHVFRFKTTAQFAAEIQNCFTENGDASKLFLMYRAGRVPGKS